MRLLPLLLIATLVSAQAAEGGAFYNPKVNTREVALNQPVVVSFTTLLPQIADIDPADVVRTALTLPSVADTWRMVGEPTVEADEKIRTLRVTTALLAREPGIHSLPEIPVRWLDGNQVARFGEVAVTDSIAFGGDRLDLPAEATAVRGYEWGLSYEELLDITGLPEAEAGPDRQLVLRPVDGLTLHIRGGRFASATLEAPGLDYSQARVAFHERWGDPIPGLGSATSTVWLAGWVRITARPGMNNEGTTVSFVHEGIAARVARSRVEAEVFSVLDGLGSGNAAQSPAARPRSESDDPPPPRRPIDSADPAPGTRQPVDTAPPPPTPTRGGSDYDPQAEFERKLRETEFDQD